MSWRSYSNQVINQVIKDNPDADEKTLRKKISEAYPFGERAMHPYKIWLDAVKKALASKRELSSKKVSSPVNIGLFENLEPGTGD